MKQITAILQPHRLEKVEAALHGLPHFPGFTVLGAQGHPRGHGAGNAFIADEWDPDHHDRLLMLIYCTDAQVDALVQVIERAANTGLAGDGLIAVTEVLQAVRIRNGVRGDAAL